MARICEHCNSTITSNSVYCPVCGMRIEDKSQKKENADFLTKATAFCHLNVSAFFNPKSFYKNASSLDIKPYFIIPAVFYVLFFLNIVTEKLITGYFSVGKMLLTFGGSILISALLFAISIFTVFYSAKLSEGEDDLMRIVKTVGAGYFVPSIFAFIGFLSNLIFKTGSFSVSLTGMILLLVPFYLLTSELNRKKDVYTYIPTAVKGILDLIVVAVIYGFKF